LLYIVAGGESLIPRRADIDPEALEQLAEFMKSQSK
jgi:hypothetical protein